MITEHDAKKVSIVINTLNRAHYLRNTLISLQYLDYASFEVIVVNGPSTDETEVLLKSWENRIKIGRCEEANLSMSRNIGIAMASGDYIAFIDDDAIPEPEWLNQIMQGFDADEIAGVGGKIIDHTGCAFQYEYVSVNRLGCVSTSDNKSMPNNCFPASYHLPYLVGTNNAYKKDALLQIKGFDEAYEYCYDETDVCLRLIDDGFFIRQLNNAFIHHKSAPSNLRDVKKVLVDRSKILKSKFYFSNRYGKPYHSQKEIDANNNEYIKLHRQDVEINIEKNLLTINHLIKFELDQCNAWQQAKIEVNSDRKLITSELLQKHQSAFKAFSTFLSKEKKKVCIFIADEEKPWGTVFKNYRDLRNGDKIYFLVPTEKHSTIDFESGVWIHRIKPEQYIENIDKIAKKRSVDECKVLITESSVKFEEVQLYIKSFNWVNKLLIEKNNFAIFYNISINEICISKYLSALKDKEIIYIPNPGNVGDALIAYATLQLFKKLKLNYKIGRHDETYKNELLVYGGGW